ncbi:MAG TPA: ACT domain-containing protein, partial [Ktedonobacterales bacterium]|nr:ACT domain-containing protein [Ktedonobacterales bacterium]
KKEEAAVPLPELPLPITEARVNLAGAGGLLAHLANCCHPLPGDPIAGYISRGRGIVIHHQQCRSLKRMQEREADRLVPVDWEQMHLNRYDAPLIVIARDRTGLLRDVTQQVHEMKLNMGSVTSVSGRRGKATITLTLQLTAKQHDDAQHKHRNKAPRNKSADDNNSNHAAAQNGHQPKAQETPVRERTEDVIRRLLNEAIQRIRTIEGVEMVDRDTRTLVPA